MDPRTERCLQLTRRQLLHGGVNAAGAAALSTLLGRANAHGAASESTRRGGLPGVPHHPPTAKRFIYLFMNGGPSQMDLFDYKPEVDKLFNQDL
ncbi:MAG: DUF1501 domain-containing protein, partial [Planctomycetales bacterium]|nr:DUF1501 domain-containing protein [Planctomycetales bacterium]